MANRSSFSRIIVALLMLLPAIMFGGLQLIARPDLEAWLAVQAQGFARPDAIFHVTAISYYFIVLFGITSLLAAYLVVAGKSQFLVPLAAGPSLTTLVYLASNGITNPDWYSLLALLGVGMLVSYWIRAETLAVAVVGSTSCTRPPEEPSPPGKSSPSAEPSSPAVPSPTIRPVPEEERETLPIITNSIGMKLLLIPAGELQIARYNCHHGSCTIPDLMHQSSSDSIH